MWRWSVDDLDGFWSSVWEFFEVGPRAPGEPALAERRMPGARWFPGTHLNYAEQVLRLRGRRGTEIVVAGRSQTRPAVDLTADDLRELVGRARAGLERLGVGPGERVVAYLPNIAETVIALLATASLGAIWSSCAPEFGTRSVVDRFAQVEPAVLITIDGYRYGSKPIDRAAEVAAIRGALPTLRATVAIPYLDPDPARITGAIPWDDFMSRPATLAFERVAFDHPLYILYSSGTTGLPKAIVHGHGGILLEHLKAVGLHTDLGPDDRFFWFTTTAG